MRILKEETDISKNEALPLSFLTDMVSKGWEEVGYLKEASAAIGTEYSNTDKVQSIMQDLIDAYLIFIGQMEAHLHQEDYIEEPEVEEDKEDNDTEDTAADKEEPDIDDEEEPKVKEKEEEIPDAEIEADLLAVQDKQVERPVVMDSDFDFFVDFDEPDMSQPRLTDDELYGHEDSEYEQARLKSMLK